MSQSNILITSAAKKTSLIYAALDAARRIDQVDKIIAGDVDKNALSQFIADEFWAMPQVSELEIENIISGCKNRNIKIIVPTRDGELLFWANNQERFLKEGVKVIVSPLRSVELCLDKLKFSEFGEKEHLDFIPSSEDPSTFKDHPIIVKERFGAGAKTLGINLSFEQTIDHSRSLNSPIFQPQIMGNEISIDAWVDKNSKVKGVVLRYRDLVVNGESQITSTFHDSIIESKIKNILEKLNLRGPVILQAIIDYTNNVHIIECNSRFGGASTASIKVGLDLLYWSFLEALGKGPKEFIFTRSKSQVRQIRIATDVYDTNI